MMIDDMSWHTPAKEYIARVCAAEYTQQRAAWKKSARTFRFSPSQYAREMIVCLNTNDEHRFKAMKMLEGYASSIGV